MTPNYSSHLLEIKKKLIHLESSYHKRKELIIKREEIEQIIQKLKEEIENQTVHFHRYPNSTNYYASSQSNYLEFEKKFAYLNRLKKEKSQLDRDLDESEDLSEEQIEQLRKQLIESILQLYPSYRLDYESKTVFLMTLTEIEKELHVLENCFLQLKDLLNQVILIRKKIKKLGLFSYIFKMSPNVMIEQRFLEGVKIIQNTQPVLKDFHPHNQNPSLQHFYSNLQDFLTKLLKHFQIRWGFHHIDTTITQAEQEASTYTNQIQQMVNEIKCKKEKLKAELNAWLDQF
jgi:hypothetical protein